MQRDWKIVAGSFCILAVALLIGTDAVIAGSNKKVKATAVSSPIDAGGKQTITLTLVIEKGWHIYANPLKWSEEYDALKTVVTVNGKLQPAKASIQYPAGKPYRDENAKATYMVYEDTVNIQTTVTRAAGDGPLAVEVDSCACTAKICLPKGTLRVTVP